MLIHILKQIWKNRKANGWIFAELALVTAILCQVADTTYVNTKVYHTPLGYDIENVWFFGLDNLSENTAGYVADTDGAEDLIRLREQIAQHPMVEEACIAFYSASFLYGTSWTSLYPVDGDTLAAKQLSFQVRRVSPEYFDVYRITDTNGNRIAPKLAGYEKAIIISADMEKLFFPGEKATGRKVARNETDIINVAAVCPPIRDDRFNISEPCFYQCLKENDIRSILSRFGSSSTELSVRMKKAYTQEEMDRFLMEMGERLMVNNLHVFNAKAIKEQESKSLRGKLNDIKKLNAVVVFVLINVFFGIVGTFWLRTQSRKEEIGLRLAIGSSRQGIKSYLYKEGLLLLALTIPTTLFYIVNLLYFDFLDNRLPYTAGRFLIAFGGTYLLVGCMIALGVSIPARKASRMQPAEALHYE